MAVSPRPTRFSDTAVGISRMTTMPVGRSSLNATGQPLPSRFISDGAGISPRPIAGGSMPLPVAGGVSQLAQPLGAPQLQRNASHLPGTVGNSSQPTPSTSYRPSAVGGSTNSPLPAAGTFQSPAAGGSMRVPVTAGNSSPMPVLGGSTPVLASTSRSASPMPQPRVVTQRAGAGGSVSLPVATPVLAPRAAESSQSCVVPPNAARREHSAPHDRSLGMAERQRSLSPQPDRLRSPQPGMAQLQEVRKTLDEHQMPAFQRGAVVQGAAASDEQRASQKLEQKLEYLQQVQQVQQADLVALERKVLEVNAREASQQAEQRLFLTSLRDEIITLASQVSSLRDSSQQIPGAEMEIVESEYGPPVRMPKEEWRSNLDSEFLQLRIDFDNKISQQEVQIKTWQTEVLQKLAKCVEDQFAQHGNLITAMLSEVKGLRLLQGEKDSESRLAELGESLQADSLTSSWQKIQVEIEETGAKQKEEGLEAIQKSSALLVKTQADLNALRDLLDKSRVEQDETSQERYRGMIRCLEAEEADLKEVHSLLKQQQTLQDKASPQQPDEVLTRWGMGVTPAQQQTAEDVVKSQVPAGAGAAAQAAREAAMLAMQRSTEFLRSNRLKDTGQVLQITPASSGPPSGRVDGSFNGGYPAELVEPLKVKGGEVVQ